MNDKTILIADDDAGLLRALSVRLESAGYHVVGALDAVQAVSVARRSAPSLLILDVNMPAGDGFTIHERIQSIDPLRGVPVIYLTGERSSRTTGGAKDMGARAILYKPVDTDHLLTAVAEALGSTSSMTKKALDDLQAAADQWAGTRR